MEVRRLFQLSVEKDFKNYVESIRLKGSQF